LVAIVDALTATAEIRGAAGVFGQMVGKGGGWDWVVVTFRTFLAGVDVRCEPIAEGRDSLELLLAGITIAFVLCN
jgi:hypothetical protein